jgi:dihydroorotate dehydrogenase electron transfer subunit
MTKDPAARIIHKQEWGDYFLFGVESPVLAGEAKPGQFLMVRVSDHIDPLLRRPLSIHARERNTLEIFFRIAGQGTTLLARKEEEDLLDILGPLGAGFRLDAGLKGKAVFLVGGGRGIAPLYFLAQELRTAGARVKVLYGGKGLPDLPLRHKFEQAGLDVACSTDDGSSGFHGLVTGLLQNEANKQKPAALFVCGPDPMMKKTAEIAAREKIPAQFSLESMMGCGFGACWGCVKRIRKSDGGAWRKICEDGPVFSADEIVWEEEG